MLTYSDLTRQKAVCAESSDGWELTAAGTPEARRKVAAGALGTALPSAPAASPTPNPRLFPGGAHPAKRLSRAKHRGLLGSAEREGYFGAPGHGGDRALSSVGALE